MAVECSPASSCSTTYGGTAAPARSSHGRSTSTSAGCGPSEGPRAGGWRPSAASAIASTRTAAVRSQLIHWLRKRIAVKLTFTLVGFVALTLLIAGPHFNRALEGLAVEGVEQRLGIAAQLLHDEARNLLARGATAEENQAFVAQASRSSGFRITLMTQEGQVVGESEVPLRDLARIENHRGRR